MSPSPAAPSTASIQRVRDPSPSVAREPARRVELSTPPSTGRNAFDQRVGVHADTGSHSSQLSRAPGRPASVTLQQPRVALDRPSSGRRWRLDQRGAQSVAVRDVAADEPPGAARRRGRPEASVPRPRRSRARGVSTTRSPSTRLIVSASGDARAQPPLPALAETAPSTRSITPSGSKRARGVVHEHHRGVLGHLLQCEPHRLRPRLAAGDRRSAPSVAAISSATRIDGSSQLGRRRDHDRVDPVGLLETLEATPASSGLPPRRANAFGRSEPSRSPRPAAARTAQTDTSET